MAFLSAGMWDDTVVWGDTEVWSDSATSSAPVFQNGYPKVSPTTGPVGTVFSIDAGTPSDTTNITYRWTLNNVQVSTAKDYTSTASGTLLGYANASGPGGSTEKSTPIALVAEPTSPPVTVTLPSMSRVASVGYEAVPIWPSKDPDDILDYALDFSPIIDDSADQLTNATAQVVEGGITITKYGYIPQDKYVVIWASGGTDGVPSKVLIRITTSKGRKVDQTVTLKIASR